MSDTGWTDARVETLKTLWREGLSAAQIAGQLGRVTRNAVLGKIHRLGLSGRAVAPRLGGQGPAWVKPRSKPAKRPPAPKRAAAAPVDIAAPAEGPGLATSILQLSANMCRWPIGDPKAADFSYCGRRVDVAGPYCPAHRLIAHRPGKLTPLACDPVVRRVLAGLAA